MARSSLIEVFEQLGLLLEKKIRREILKLPELWAKLSSRFTALPRPKSKLHTMAIGASRDGTSLGNILLG